jgi:beta-mannosidase
MDSTRVFWRDTTSAFAFRQRSAMPWIEPEFDGFDMIDFYVDELFGEPKDFKSFVLLSQFVQAEALTNAIESHRRKKPFTMGSLYWQLNDVWPTVSWSSVDYLGRWKPAHFAVQESFKNIIVSLWADEDSLRVSIISDLLNPITGTFIFSVKTMDGSQIHRESFEITIPKNSSRLILEADLDLLCKGYSKDSVFAEASFINPNGVIDRGLITFVQPKDLALSNPQLSTRIKKIHDRFEIRIQSQNLAKYVTVNVEGIEGIFSENYFDIPPGREHMVTFHPKNPVSDISDKIQIHSLIDAINP